MSDIARALADLAPGKTWALENVSPADSDADQYAAIDWRDEGDPPTLADLQDKAAELKVEVETADVDALRNEKIAAGFIFDGTLYQSRPGDLENIAGAATSAVAALIAGAQAGDLRWADPDQDFAWIASDNGMVTMDAPTVVAFGNAAMAHKSGLIFAASAIKARLRAGETIADIAAAPEWP